MSEQKSSARMGGEAQELPPPLPLPELPPPLPPLSPPPSSPLSSPPTSYEIDYEQDFKKFLNVAKSMRLNPKTPLHDYHAEFDRLKSFITPEIRNYLTEKKAAKVHLAIYANFFKMKKDSDEILETKAFHLDTKSRLFFEDEPIQPKLDGIFHELSKRIEQKLYDIFQG